MTLVSKRGNDPTELALSILRGKFGDFECPERLILAPGPSQDGNTERHDEDWVRNESPELDCGKTFVGGWGEVRKDSFIGLCDEFRRHTAEHSCFWVLTLHKFALRARDTGDVEEAMTIAMRLGEAVRELELSEVICRARARYLAEAKTVLRKAEARRPLLLAMKQAGAHTNPSQAAKTVCKNPPKGETPHSVDALRKKWERYHDEV